MSCQEKNKRSVLNANRYFVPYISYYYYYEKIPYILYRISDSKQKMKGNVKTPSLLDIENMRKSIYENFNEHFIINN